MSAIDPIRDIREGLSQIEQAQDFIIGAVVFAHDHDGMTFRAIAAAVGKPTTWVYNTYRKASN
jgi:hypothetical protein